MWRVLFNSFTVFSLAMSIVCAFAWVRSHRWYESIGWDGEQISVSVNGCDGLACLSIERFSVVRGPEYERGWGTSGYAIDAIDYERYWPKTRYVGFGTEGSVHCLPGNGVKLTRTTAPFWAIMLAGLVAPFFWVVRRIQRMRRAEFACVGCGYDLRASSGECPECGAAIQTVSAPSIIAS
jgi:hypothetical protein